MQAYSARFTALGTRIQHMTSWSAAFGSAKSLDVRVALDTLTSIGREILNADHVIIYRYVGDEYWAVAPEGHWAAQCDGRSGANDGIGCGDGGSAVASRRPEELGRGMAGYVAQVFHLRAAKASGALALCTVM